MSRSGLVIWCLPVNVEFYPTSRTSSIGNGQINCERETFKSKCWDAGYGLVPSILEFYWLVKIYQKRMDMLDGRGLRVRKCKNNILPSFGWSLRGLSDLKKCADPEKWREFEDLRVRSVTFARL